MAHYDIESSSRVKINLTNINDLIDFKNGPPSISVTTANFAEKLLENQTIIGCGNKVVTLRHGNRILGPIYSKDKNEIKDIFVLFKDKIKCRKYVDKHGVHHLHKTFTKSEEASKARKSLPADVVEYIDKAFAISKRQKTTSRGIYFAERAKFCVEHF